MTKTMILAAALPALLLTAAPAFAQAAPTGCPKGFDGPHCSATNLRDRPSEDPTAAKPRKPAFNGPHGSASDLTNRPSEDPTDPDAATAGHVKVFDGRTGAELRQAPQRSRGLVKHGAGTLTLGNKDRDEAGLLLPAAQKVREAAARSQKTNN